LGAAAPIDVGEATRAGVRPVILHVRPRDPWSCCTANVGNDGVVGGNNNGILLGNIGNDELIGGNARDILTS